MGKKAILNDWAVEATRHFGGSAHHLDIAKWIWDNKRDELFNMGDLFYTWQYDLRWSGTNLRQAGVLKPASECASGTWILNSIVADKLYPREE